MHAKKKKSWCIEHGAMLSRSIMFNSFETPWTVAHQAPLSMGILQTRILEWVPSPPPGDLLNPEIEPRQSAGRLFTVWAPGKSKNTGVGSQSLLQGISLTQKLNQGLLHCRWILYRLSHHGSPWSTVNTHDWI